MTLRQHAIAWENCRVRNHTGMRCQQHSHAINCRSPMTHHQNAVPQAHLLRLGWGRDLWWLFLSKDGHATSNNEQAWFSLYAFNPPDPSTDPRALASQMSQARDKKAGRSWRFLTSIQSLYHQPRIIAGTQGGYRRHQCLTNNTLWEGPYQTYRSCPCQKLVPCRIK